MKLKIQPSFVRDTKKSPKHIITQLDTIFSLITTAKKPTDIPGLKKLSGYKNAYRIPIDDYRVGLLLEDDTIVLSRLLSRKDVYKYFP